MLRYFQVFAFDFPQHSTFQGQSQDQQACQSTGSDFLLVAHLLSQVGLDGKVISSLGKWMPILRRVLAAFFFFAKSVSSLVCDSRVSCQTTTTKKMEYDISVQVIKKALIYANLQGRYANKNQQQEKTKGSYLLLWTIRNLIKLAALLLTLGRKVFLYLFLKKGKQRVNISQ